MARADLIGQLSIAPQATLLAAIQRMTEAAEKILLIIGPDGRLQGVVTDYDIRLAILNRTKLETPVGDVIKHLPVTAGAGSSEREIIALIERTACQQIPILDAAGRPVDIRFHHEFVQLRQPVSDHVAVLMAGGFGSRLRPMTDHVPKPLLDVGGRPMLFAVLDQLLGEGFATIYVSVYYKSEMIIERVRETSRYRNRVEFVIEDAPLGTAGSLSLLPCRPERPFLIINADVMIEIPLREMVQFHCRAGNAITLALKRQEFVVPYGVAEVVDGRIVGLREKPSIAYEVNTGAYVASPEILDRLQHGQKCDMPELIAQLLADDARVGSFPVHEFWLDIGTHTTYDQARRKFDAAGSVDDG